MTPPSWLIAALVLTHLSVFPGGNFAEASVAGIGPRYDGHTNSSGGALRPVIDEEEEAIIEELSQPNVCLSYKKAMVGCIKYCAKKGYIEALKRIIITPSFDMLAGYVVMKAASQGHFQFVEWALRSITGASRLLASPVSGHLDDQLLYERLIEDAVWYDDQAFLSYLSSMNPKYTWNPSKEQARDALLWGNFSVLEWLRRRSSSERSLETWITQQANLGTLQEFLRAAALQGKLGYLESANSNGDISEWCSMLAEMALEGGHLNVLDWLLEINPMETIKGVDQSTSLLIGTQMDEELVCEIVHWILARTPKSLESTTFIRDIFEGEGKTVLSCLHYYSPDFVIKTIKEDATPPVYDKIFKWDLHEIVRGLLEAFPGIELDLFQGVIKHDSAMIASKIVGAYGLERFVPVIVRRSSVKVLAYVMKALPFGFSYIPLEQVPNVETLRVLIENGYQHLLSTETLERFIQDDKLEMLQLLHETRFEFPTIPQKNLDDAAESRNQDNLVIWFYETFNILPSKQALINSYESQNKSLIDILMDFYDLEISWGKEDFLSAIVDGNYDFVDVFVTILDDPWAIQEVVDKAVCADAHETLDTLRDAWPNYRPSKDSIITAIKQGYHKVLSKLDEWDPSLLEDDQMYQNAIYYGPSAVIKYFWASRLDNFIKHYQVLAKILCYYNLERALNDISWVTGLYPSQEDWEWAPQNGQGLDHKMHTFVQQGPDCCQCPECLDHANTSQGRQAPPPIISTGTWSHSRSYHGP